MTALTLSLRSSSGLSVIWMRPLLSVVLVPSMPMNDEMLATAGIRQDHASERALPLAHRIERDVLRRLRDPEDDARVLNGKSPFGTTDVEARRSARACHGHHEGGGLVREHPAQRPPVEGDEPVERALAARARSGPGGARSPA
jgi:hypothetical protein